MLEGLEFGVKASSQPRLTDEAPSEASPFMQRAQIALWFKSWVQDLELMI